MKTLLLGVGLVVIMFLIVTHAYDNSYEVENVDVAPVEVTPTAEELFEQAVQKTIEEAITASSSDIEAAKVEAANKVELEMKEEIEERVRKEMRDRVWTLDEPTTRTVVARSEVERIIIEAFPEDPQTALAIAKCESGLRPDAHNPHNRNGSTDGGLWQINSVHIPELQRLGLDKYNPHDATKFARILYERNGWNDWVCYTRGLHLAML